MSVNKEKFNLLDSDMISVDIDHDELDIAEQDLQALKEIQKEFVNMRGDQERESREQNEELKSIENEIMALKDIQSSFNELVDVQGEKLDESEVHVQKTENNVEKAAESLEKASIYAQLYRNRAVRTVGGAVVGGLLFGGVGSIFGGMGLLLGSGIGTSSGAVVGAVST